MQLDRRLCVFDEISIYLESAEKIHRSRKIFFLSVNLLFRDNEPISFYMDAIMVEKTFRKFFKRAWAVVDVTGDGVQNSFTCHGLRATAITNLFDAGYFMETISLNSVHR